MSKVKNIALALIIGLFAFSCGVDKTSIAEVNITSPVADSTQIATDTLQLSEQVSEVANPSTKSNSTEIVPIKVAPNEIVPLKIVPKEVVPNKVVSKDTISNVVAPIKEVTTINSGTSQLNEFIEYEFFSWFQFSVIAFLCSLLFFAISRFHLFRKLVKEKSLGFRMFLYILTVIVVVSFILIRPLYHLLFLMIVVGLFFKNIVSYSRALFSLYFSKVQFGDKISIGDETGILDDMNFGGLHLLTTENKVYFPFNMWKEKKIILESEAGTVLISFKCKDLHERSPYQSLNDLKSNLFNYPFLAVSNVIIEQETDVFSVTARISNNRYKAGLQNHIDKAGFQINRDKN